VRLESFFRRSTIEKLLWVMFSVASAPGLYNEDPTYTGSRLAHGFQIPCVYDYIRNYAGDRQKPYRMMRINMFVVWDKENPDIENITGLNLAVVKLTTVQVTRLPL
jgi:hypothetical protein